LIKKIIYSIGSILCEVVIPYSAKIDGGISFPHAKCIIIHEKCIVGKNVTILSGVTIGGNIFKKKGGRTSPTIGENVLIGTGAKILGPVTIGKNSMIGANAVVVKDIPEDSVAVGVPAKVVKTIDKSFIDLCIDNKTLKL
jgi:serine O-acetyltransferase